MALTGDWEVEQRCGPVEQLHGSWPADDSRAHRIVAVCRPVAPLTLVLGSSQSPPDLDADAAKRLGLAITRRSSGGGAVLIAPSSQVWIDVWLPRDDPHWDDDVIGSSQWLGKAWRDALAGLGVRDTEVSNARMSRTDWSDLICFAGVGPGEVLWRNRKLVGLSQRRDRYGARFLTVSPVAAVGIDLLQLLALDPSDRDLVETFVSSTATCLSEVLDVLPTDAEDLLQRVEQAVVSCVVASVVASVEAPGLGDG